MTAPGTATDFSPARVAETIANELAALDPARAKYLGLQQQMDQLEGELQVARKEYSTSVRAVLSKGMIGAGMLKEAGFADPLPASGKSGKSARGAAAASSSRGKKTVGAEPATSLAPAAAPSGALGDQ